MDIISDMGIGIPKGLKPSDKQRLVDITNEAVANNDSVKTSMVSHVNAKAETSLPNTTTWQKIEDTIDGIDTTKDLVIEYGNLQPYYETIQGNGWSKTLEDNINCIKVNTLGDMSVYISDVNNNLYKFDTNGNQIWKVNVGINILYIDCDTAGNIYLTCGSTIGTTAYKYNSSGTKVFTYARKDGTSGTLNLIFGKFDLQSNSIMILYSITDSSVIKCFWDKYDSSNSLITHNELKNSDNSSLNLDFVWEKLVYASTLSTGELIVYIKTSFIRKFNTAGILSQSYSARTNSAFTINNDYIILTEVTPGASPYTIFMSKLDSNLNIIGVSTQESYNSITDSWRCIAIFYNDNNGNLNNLKFLDNNTFIADSKIINKMGIVKYDESSKYIKIYSYKMLNKGIFDSDNKFLYYSETNTNKISKITFDKDIKNNVIQTSIAYGVADDLIDFCNDSNNNYYMITYKAELIKLDTDLNMVFTKAVNTYAYYNTLIKIFIKDENIFIIEDSSSSYNLIKYDLNGNLISSKIILTHSNPESSDALYRLIKYNTIANQIILVRGNYGSCSANIFDLNGNIILSFGPSIGLTNESSINYDNLGNIYILFQRYVYKYDSQGNYIWKFNSNNHPIIDYNDLETKVYLANGDHDTSASASSGITIINKSGTAIESINTDSYIAITGLIKKGLIYYVSSLRSPTSHNWVLTIASLNNTDNPIYITIPFYFSSSYINNDGNIWPDVDCKLVVDSNDDIILGFNFTSKDEYGSSYSTIYLYKIPAIKNTNPYQIFKGYKIVGYK